MWSTTVLNVNYSTIALNYMVGSLNVDLGLLTRLELDIDQDTET